MKTTHLLRFGATFLIAASTLFVSCKKDSSASSSGDTTADAQTQSNDATQVSTELDASTSDAENTMEATSSFSGNSATQVSENSTAVGGSATLSEKIICDASFSYDTVGSNRVITITYDGTNCWGNRERQGVVTVSLPLGQHWKDAGATAVVSFQNLKITKVSSGKSFTINGTKTFTNVSGGLLKDLATLGTITRTITSDDLSITFDDNTQRSWHVARQRVYSYDNGIVITTTGMHSDGTDNDIVEWGTNRFGNAFTNLITQPRVIRQDCDFRLTAGQNELKVNRGTIVITYGLDSNGDPTTCPGTGTYYFKLVFTNNKGTVYTYILPY